MNSRNRIIYFIASFLKTYSLLFTEIEILELTEKLKTQTNIALKVEQLQKEIQALKIQAEGSEKKFLECNKELNQEQAKNKSMAKHFEVSCLQLVGEISSGKDLMLTLL